MVIIIGNRHAFFDVFLDEILLIYIYWFIHYWYNKVGR